MEYQHLLSRRQTNGSGALVADQSVAIVIKYKGNQASATVTVSSGDITLKHGAAAAEAVDSTVGVAGVVADGTYTTLGAMVDAINNSANWTCEIVDGLRADVSTAALKTLSEYTFAPTRGEAVNLFFDTSAFLSLSFRISARRGFFTKRSQKGKVSVFKATNALVNTGSGVLTLYVYDVDKASATTKLLGQWAGTDNTDLAATIAAGQGDLRSAAGNDLLVRYTGTGDLPDSGAYLNVAGYIHE